MPLGPVLTESDRLDLRTRLQEVCEQRWADTGYRRTNVQVLCREANVSIGTFYTLFPKKEDLFFATVLSIQDRLQDAFLKSCQTDPNKLGFAHGMKTLIREFAAKPFLYDVNKPDYRAFIAKLSSDELGKLRFDSIDFFRAALQAASLRLTLNEEQAFGVFSALLSTVFAKDTISMTCDYYSVFDFMVDHLMDDIFR